MGGTERSYKDVVLLDRTWHVSIRNYVEFEIEDYFVIYIFDNWGLSTAGNRSTILFHFANNAFFFVRLVTLFVEVVEVVVII